jgi:hypothetical protein
MARIDVSELMLDPDFVMNFTIVRRTSTVNNFGENVLAETTVSAVGSIQAATGETAKRLPDGVQLSKFKTIFTKAVIRADSAGQYQDQIEYKSQRYNVFQVLPWEDFGAGWYMVDVELEKASL